eukprot:scaffold682_cov231-Pinguiococcus_pyrenoidosus.AAC.2
MPRILPRGTKISAISVASPSVIESRPTVVNPDLHGNGRLFDRKLDLCSSETHFRRYGMKPKVVLFSAAKDGVVNPEEVRSVFGVMRVFPSALERESAWVAIKFGAHIGFGNSLKLNLKLFNAKIPQPAILDLLIYALDVGECIWGDLDAQLVTTKKLMVRHFAAYGGSKDTSGDFAFSEKRTEWSEVVEVHTDSKQIWRTLIGSPP